VELTQQFKNLNSSMKKTAPRVKKAEVQKGDNVQVLVRVRPFNDKEKGKANFCLIIIR
jgi:hypothetical protein